MNIKNLFSGLSEESLIDKLAKVAPWITPTLPASFTYHNLENVMKLSTAEAVVGALVVEIFGLVVIHTTNQFHQSNQEYGSRETYNKQPVGLMVGMSLFYVSSVIIINLLLDLSRPPMEIAARALLTLISIPAAVVLTARYSFQREMRKIEEKKQQGKTAYELGQTRKDLEKAKAELGKSKEKLDKLEQERKESSQLERELERELESAQEKIGNLERKLAERPEIIIEEVVTKPRKKVRNSSGKVTWKTLPESDQKQVGKMDIDELEAA
jgi:hypothetical protein